MSLLLFIHLIAVTYWVGGQIFLLTVLVPSLRGEDESIRTRLTRDVAIRYTNQSLAALAVIVTTGTLMARTFGYIAHPTDAFWAKMACVSIAILATVFHIFAARRGRLRGSYVARTAAFVASIVAVWFAVHI